ncbi:MAG: hypothetical protein HN936_03820, partial [Bacteroidetes bacterium]|nr:hypothetical protein [Bacteroidota bacterium]
MLDYIPQAALAEAAIGTAGGELAVDELSLHIPAGCFDQTETIGVYVNGASGPYHESSYTQRYEIQGLPFVLSKPIRIQIAYSGEPLDEAYISIEREHTGPGTPENELFYFPIEAVDSSGYLVAYLPEFGLDTLKSTTKTNTATKPTSLTIEGLWIKKSKLTDDGHFKLIWPYNETKPEHLNLIGAYLEGAYKYFNLPPSYQLDAIYSRLPKITKVHFTKSQGNTESIWVAADYGGFGEYILNVNTTGSDFANPELLHSKVYAAFYQLVHLTTLPYLRIFTHNLGVTLGGVPTATAAQMNEDFLWFSSACGAWAETLITENRQYLFSSTAAASFKGYQFAHGKGDFLVEEHGIGMGLQLYFLTEKFGTEILLKTWTNGEAEMKTLDVVLMNQVTLPVDWLQDYYQTFILTYPAIFDIDLQTLVDETVEIKSGEKEYSIEGEYLDMSAKLYNLVIDPDDYMNKDLEFRLQGADWKYNNITLFTHNEQFGDVKFLDTGGTSLKLINVGDELDQNQHILAMVSHLRAITPYYDLVPITFEINVTEKEFESIAMDFQLLGYFNGVLSDGSEVENYANAVGSTIPTFNWEG